MNFAEWPSGRGYILLWMTLQKASLLRFISFLALSFFLVYTFGGNYLSHGGCSFGKVQPGFLQKKNFCLRCGQRHKQNQLFLEADFVAL